MALLNDLISYILNTNYEDLPDQEVNATKRSVFDTLGCAIAGSSVGGLDTLVELVRQWGGVEENTLFIFGGRVPVLSAALVNCTMARALDLDDLHYAGGGHVSSTIVPSALTIAEYSKVARGKVINGRQFITAVTIGLDLHCRLRMAGIKAARASGWTSETFGPIAVAAMGARMLGLDKEKTTNAMGIGFVHCSNTIQSSVEGVSTYRLGQGFASKAGILSVILADKGFTGPQDMLEGKFGLYPVYTRGEFFPEVLVGQLGKRFEGSNIAVKPYPSCTLTHSAIFGALQLANEYKIAARDIEKVNIFTNQRAYDMCGPEEKNAPPKTAPDDGVFNLYYTVATALVKGKLFIEDFTEKAFRNRQVLAMMPRIHVFVDKEKDKIGTPLAPVDVEIYTRDGKRFKKTSGFVIGTPENPMTMADIIQKFRNCVPFSARPLPGYNVERIIQMIQDLEKLDDVTEIIECLVAS
jgi:2-methylcitrate dehydratase PrpD